MCPETGIRPGLNSTIVYAHPASLMPVLPINWPLYIICANHMFTFISEHLQTLRMLCLCDAAIDNINVWHDLHPYCIRFQILIREEFEVGNLIFHLFSYLVFCEDTMSDLCLQGKNQQDFAEVIFLAISASLIVSYRPCFL